MSGIGQCCRECYDGENATPEHCSCLCHEDAKTEEAKPTSYCQTCGNRPNLHNRLCVLHGAAPMPIPAPPKLVWRAAKQHGFACNYPQCGRAADVLLIDEKDKKLNDVFWNGKAHDCRCWIHCPVPEDEVTP
jgi:hypothetical protein